MPALLVEHFYEMSSSERAKGIARAWTMAEFPSRILEPRYWTSMWEQSVEEDEFIDGDGAVHNHCELPSTLTLWRGALPEFSFGMSWSIDRERATWFARRFDNANRENIKGALYEITVPSSLILGRFDERGESEFVVDLMQLNDDDVTEVTF